MSGWCWSRPAGGSGDRPPAQTVPGAGSARSLDAAGPAGRAPFPTALARLGRIERTLHQCRQHRFCAGTAALRGHRHRDPGGIGGHARRCGARALHRPGPALGEPALRRFRGGLGRAARRRRRGHGAHGTAPGGAAGPWRLAQAASGRAALHAFRLQGVRHGLPRGPGPAAETALGAFRRALEGTLASAGAHARRLEPDALLSLAAELVAPDIHGERDGETKRPVRRWSPRDPIHEQCIAPGRALTVAPTGLTFHHPDSEDDASGGDIAVRVLSAIAFPEVWPGWRGNALIGDFHRDFLQPGAPVLTCLTVVTGDEAAGEKAFLKSARAMRGSMEGCIGAAGMALSGRPAPAPNPASLRLRKACRPGGWCRDRKGCRQARVRQATVG